MPGLIEDLLAERAQLVQERLDPLRERVASTMQAALHRPEVHAGDLGDLLVALALELAETEDEPVMLGELLDRVLDQPPQVPLAVEVIRPHGVILELDRPMILLPVARQPLEEHERAARAVAKLVLRQVARDRVD